MDVQLLTVLVTAVVSVATTVVAGLYGPAWKARVDTRRAAQQRSEQVIRHYSEPLARAAFDLQSRLYNICRQHFLEDEKIPPEYRRFSTLWILGQFLAWVEIVRREVQVIDFGDIRRTTSLQRHLFDVVDILGTNSGDHDQNLRVFRAEQRAIGELMVTERRMGDRHRSDSLGYGEFVHRMETEPDFARWFAKLDQDVQRLMGGGGSHLRLALAQRALIGLIDFLDPDLVRFPEPNERGRIPVPPGQHDRKRTRPPTQVARFLFEGDPLATVESWARERHLPVLREPAGTVRVRLSRRTGLVGHDVVVLRTPPWVELHVVRRSQPVAGPSPTGAPLPSPIPRPQEADAVNDLLRRFDRPPLPRRPSIRS